MSKSSSDVHSCLAGLSDAARPFVTYIGDEGRTELSVSSVRNAVAKIANALTLEFDLEPGSPVGVQLPWHWQRVTWLLGIWSAGCTALFDDVSLCSVMVSSPQLLVSSPRLTAETSVPTLVVSLHPFGLPLDEQAFATLPESAEDAAIVVRRQPDQQIVTGHYSDVAAVPDVPQRQLLDMGRNFAGDREHVKRLGINSSNPYPWLPAVWPLVSGGSTIMGQDFTAEVIDRERIDQIAD